MPAVSREPAAGAASGSWWKMVEGRALTRVQVARTGGGGRLRAMKIVVTRRVADEYGARIREADPGAELIIADLAADGAAGWSGDV
ncbi:MAG TPA: hypothetical protein VFY79_03040, partial [Dehalococcoidia bacterium]|nr:hypothetical protein [Dehalococcoidia bacterium]